MHYPSRLAHRIAFILQRKALEEGIMALNEYEEKDPGGKLISSLNQCQVCKGSGTLKAKTECFACMGKGALPLKSRS